MAVEVNWHCQNILTMTGNDAVELIQLKEKFQEKEQEVSKLKEEKELKEKEIQEKVLSTECPH